MRAAALRSDRLSSGYSTSMPARFLGVSCIIGHGRAARGAWRHGTLSGPTNAAALGPPASSPDEAPCEKPKEQSTVPLLATATAIKPAMSSSTLCRLLACSLARLLACSLARLLPCSLALPISCSRSPYLSPLLLWLALAPPSFTLALALAVAVACTCLLALSHTQIHREHTS